MQRLLVLILSSLLKSLRRVNPDIMRQPSKKCKKISSLQLVAVKNIRIFRDKMDISEEASAKGLDVHPSELFKGYEE